MGESYAAGKLEQWPWIGGRAGQKILISTDESEEDRAESLGEQNPAEAKPDTNPTEPSV
ncbi:MAG TPA: hypothetical protein PLX77_07295 [Candidatus Cloacimonadota bacterium]|nr:hypothetical protein [Candidatus Cloacimonadota bacterium]